MSSGNSRASGPVRAAGAAAKVASACAALLAAGACGRHDPGPGQPGSLQASLGVYQDGSGRAGLAVLATMRDASGNGPAAALSAAVSDGKGTLAVGEYPGRGPGSYAAWWWPEVAVRAGAPYTLTLTDGAQTFSTQMTGATAGGLAPAAPALSADSSRIGWPAVPGAASYLCRVYQAGVLALDALSAAPGCDVSALPAGGYQASILATSADLVGIAASTSRTPALPATFDVSESRLSFVRPAAGGTGLEMLAAGGALDFGSSVRGLAVWVSLRKPGGGATDKAWTMSIAGPGISPSAPATFQYAANMPRQMAWSYDLPATPGTYTLTATSGTDGLAATFTVGYPPSLPFVLDAAATSGASGSATVTWTPVDGARAYLVDVWDRASRVHVQSMWVAAPPATFPQYTFTAGRTYDAYVAATDADMAGGAVPTQVSVSEYPYFHASFVE